MDFVMKLKGCIFDYHTIFVSRHKRLIINPLLLTTPTLFPFVRQDISLAVRVNK